MTPSKEAIAREAASEFVYSVYKWRGMSAAFMQYQVRNLTGKILSAIDKATEQLRQRVEESESRALSAITSHSSDKIFLQSKLQPAADTKRLDWLEKATPSQVVTFGQFLSKLNFRAAIDEVMKK
jgi:hypothetical protein